jgi:hypothetical protein
MIVAMGYVGIIISSRSGAIVYWKTRESMIGEREGPAEAYDSRFARLIRLLWIA